MILEKQRAVNINRFELPMQKELTEDFVKGYMRLAHLYRGAMMEVSTKLEILDDELSVTYDQYHGYYHVVGDRGILEELVKLAKNKVKNIYEYLNIKIEQQENN